MGNLSTLESIIDGKLLALHTAYIGKVISISGNTAKIQPLTMTKAVGGTAQKQAVVTAHITSNARYKPVPTTLQYVSGVSDHTASYSTASLLTYHTLAAGDVVVCIVAERDISNAVSGKISDPTPRHHDLSDSVVIAQI